MKKIYIHLGLLFVFAVLLASAPVYAETSAPTKASEMCGACHDMGYKDVKMLGPSSAARLLPAVFTRSLGEAKVIIVQGPIAPTILTTGQLWQTGDEGRARVPLVATTSFDANNACYATTIIGQPAWATTGPPEIVLATGAVETMPEVKLTKLTKTMPIGGYSMAATVLTTTVFTVYAQGLVISYS